MEEVENNIYNFLKIKKKDAQEIIKLLNTKLRNEIFLNQKIRILYEDEYILLPLIKSKEIIKKVSNITSKHYQFEISARKGVKNPNYSFKSLKEALKNKLPSNILEVVPSSYDIIGNIAILEFDLLDQLKIEDSNHYKKAIAEAVTIVNKAVSTVYEKKSEIKGKFRLRELNLLKGEDNPETIHKENHCTFKLNVKNSYYTPRLVFERRRITQAQIKKEELIIDLFAGVGPFSIQLAKNFKVNIFAFDFNPHAYNYLKENIKLNKLKGKIHPFNLDIRDLTHLSHSLGNFLKNKADRIIMNLPELSINYIDLACYLMKKQGGILHNYQFSNKPDSIKKAIDNLEKSLNSYSWLIEDIINSKVVKAYSPKSDLVVVDLKIRSN